jgi:hypothetical protein
MNWKNLFVSLLFILGMEGAVLSAFQRHSAGVQVAETKSKCPSEDGNFRCAQ